MHHLLRLSYVLLLTCCVRTPTAFALEHAHIHVGTVPFHVEIAQTVSDRARGLMEYPKLAADQGMLFVQPIGPAVFWMKNVIIPLDLLYFDSAGRLLQIIADAPPCTTPECPLYPSTSTHVRYVLEINGGAARTQHLQIGDRLHYPPAIP